MLKTADFRFFFKSSFFLDFLSETNQAVVKSYSESAALFTNFCKFKDLDETAYSSDFFFSNLNTLNKFFFFRIGTQQNW